MLTLLAMERDLLLFIQEHIRQDWLTPIMKIFTALGEHGIFVIIVTLLFLCFSRTRKMGISCACGLVLSFVVNNLIIKNVVARIRPYNAIDGLVCITNIPLDFSFPSGHTAVVFVMAIILFRRVSGKIGIFALVVAALVAFSRLYLGVHYLSDVLVGAISGGMLGYLAARIVDKVILEKSNKNIL